VRVLWRSLRSGSLTSSEGRVGETLLHVAHSHGIPLEGACEGSCACSTCHVVLPDAIYRRLPEPSDEENDMLDMAYGLTPSSRLGCQVRLEPWMSGLEVSLPVATRNFAVDGHVTSGHH
jgi:ferredoxin